jgi:hypothetical protein
MNGFSGDANYEACYHPHPPINGLSVSAATRCPRILYFPKSGLSGDANYECRYIASSYEWLIGQFSLLTDKASLVVE